MARCRSWRYLADSGDLESMPGMNRDAWVLCRNKVEHGKKRCAQCLDALLFHPNPVIRRSLAMEPGLSTSTLEFMLEDSSITVVAEAEAILRHRKENQLDELVSSVR